MRPSDVRTGAQHTAKLQLLRCHPHVRNPVLKEGEIQDHKAAIQTGDYLVTFPNLTATFSPLALSLQSFLDAPRVQFTE